MVNRPRVLSIAGYDPCAGAGVLADVKTLEFFGVQAMAVVTGLTNQTEEKFWSLNWQEEYALEQLDTLLARYEFQVIKIGLIPSLDFLEIILQKLDSQKVKIPIIWDPILSASSGFSIHEGVQVEQLNSCLEKITLLTPNIPECMQLFPQGVEYISHDKLHIMLKSGHAEGDVLADELWRQGKLLGRYPKEKIPQGEKHGSGCVLSSLIAGYLAWGADVPTACRKASLKISEFLGSSKTLLGNWGHSLQPIKFSQKVEQ